MTNFKKAVVVVAFLLMVLGTVWLWKTLIHDVDSIGIADVRMWTLAQALVTIPFLIVTPIGMGSEKAGE